jgi:hypothetical protein
LNTKTAGKPSSDFFKILGFGTDLLWSMSVKKQQERKGTIPYVAGYKNVATCRLLNEATSLIEFSS